ncbi:MAG: prepilin-type cleavage/methylation domain-containing protein [Betaproteobacteria bacterium HGW-Betaproteobacteria-22]|nr:MAG: prepilin-type cleavage/methylation domain-containing protein [Betaproteobacteria bacterium HGW-Betaproteobacteria-22]
MSAKNKFRQVRQTKIHLPKAYAQSGFSLVELLVGLVIGLLATMVIMQVFSVFEGQKRSTSGSADAQTNGSIALHSIQRDAQMAGFGLPVPMADKENTSLKCDPAPTFDHDVNPATPDLELSPVTIVDGISDTITVRYSNSGMGAVPVKIVNATNATAATGLSADNNLGCRDDDIVLISNGTSCVMTQVADANGDPNTLVNISLVAATPAGGPLVAGAKLTCMGNWRNLTYQVVANQLQLNDVPIVSEVVNLQAQYGISAAANSSVVTQWVDATGGWAAPSVADRNRIKAIRVAVVARNNLLEKEVVTDACSSTTVANPTGLCAWDATSAAPAIASPAPDIDLTGIANWNRYRYRVYETIIPLRNMIWSKDAL